jgi:hypothetical protein
MGTDPLVAAWKVETRQVNVPAIERAKEKARDREDQTERKTAKKQIRHA